MKAWQAILDAAAPDCAALRAACRDPRAQQQALLLRIVQAGCGTQFGAAHDFGRIRNIDDYRAAVPMRRDEDFAPWIERIGQGERGVLTRDGVVAFEETGGSAAGAKLVPYTAASLVAFRAAVLPWLAALAARRPGVCAGPAYAAVSPRMRPARTLPCGVPVGLPSEAAYLGEDLYGPLSELLVAPGDAPDGEATAWRTRTLAALVAHRDLAFVSIYSPTFVLELVEALPACFDEVARVLGREDRARLQAAVGQHVDTERLWPRLDTIAAWTEGASAAYARRLAEVFPHAHVDARGVLATESAVTVRIDGDEGCVPALASAVLEFVDRGERVHASHDLARGERYRVVLTTPGGLYRYDLQDEFECVGFCAQAPRLRFLGRTGIASDLVGEKLTDAFVAQALAPLPSPAALVPAAGSKPHYELWIDGAAPDHDRLAHRTDALLKANPQYDYARQAGQLGPLRVVASPGFMHHRAATLAHRGMRAGDVKATALILDRSTLPHSESRPP